MKKKAKPVQVAVIARGKDRTAAAKGKPGSLAVSVVVEGKKRKHAVPSGTTAQSLADRHGLNGQTFFIKINRKLAHPSAVLKEGDVVEFVGIIYGG